MSDQWRITYSIEQSSGDDEYREIGYGSSSSHDSVDAALFEIVSTIGNGLWEIPGPVSLEQQETQP